MVALLSILVGALMSVQNYIDLHTIALYIFLNKMREQLNIMHFMRLFYSATFVYVIFYNIFISIIFKSNSFLLDIISIGMYKIFSSSFLIFLLFRILYDQNFSILLFLYSIFTYYLIKHVQK